MLRGGQVRVLREVGHGPFVIGCYGAFMAEGSALPVPTQLSQHSSPNAALLAITALLPKHI